VAVVVVVVLAGIFVAKGIQRDRDYALAGRDASRILAAAGRAYPVSPRRSIVIGPTPLYHHGVVGLIGIEDQAGRAFLHRPDIHIYVAQHAHEYYDAPAALRLDTRMMRAATASPAHRMRNGTTTAPQ
jgi:hypothetical protein